MMTIIDIIKTGYLDTDEIVEAFEKLEPELCKKGYSIQNLVRVLPILGFKKFIDDLSSTAPCESHKTAWLKRYTNDMIDIMLETQCINGVEHRQLKDIIDGHTPNFGPAVDAALCEYFCYWYEDGIQHRGVRLIEEEFIDFMSNVIEWVEWDESPVVFMCFINTMTNYMERFKYD